MEVEIGEHVASNGGVVVSEELIPYLDIPLGEEVTGDESYIFPVLLRYHGHPEIDDEGNILYVFPSLQRSTTSPRYHTNQHAGQICTTYTPNVKEAFKERTLNFSKTNADERAIVAGLGALNVTGVLILQYMLMNGAQLPTTNNFAGNVVHFVVAIFPLLQIYAASFFVIPLLHWIFLVKTNKEIGVRNNAREKRVLALERPGFLLRQKLRSARDMTQTIAVDEEDHIIYNTKEGKIKRSRSGLSP